MESVKEVKEWLDTLDPDGFVGIDEGGLTLREVVGDEMTGSYFEIGGIPVEIENG